MKINPTDPAYPIFIQGDDRCASRQHGGLTKREYFAAMAMQGLISSMTIHRDEMSEYVSETALKYADALIKAYNDSVEGEGS